jgi:hypothetical protein
MRGLLVAFLLAVVLLAAAVGDAASPGPKLFLTSVSVRENVTVDLRLRFCASIGPKAVLVVNEVRKVGRSVRTRKSWVEPLGVDAVDVGPYDCVTGWRESWLVQPRSLFSGPGVYSVTIRVRDGFGRVSAPASFSLQAGTR